EHQQLFATARRGGFARVRVDGFVRDLSEDITLDKMKKHSVEVVVDRLGVRRGAEAEAERSRLTDSAETALRLGEGLAPVAAAAVLNGTEDALKLTYENRNGQRRSYEYEWEGVLPWLDRQYRETTSDFIRADIERYMSERPCPVCKGKRLKPEALAVTIGGRNIAAVTALTVGECLEWTTALEKDRGGLGIRERKIAKQVLKEIRTRLGFLMDVGLDYLTV